jgi:hypothetical protein
MNWINGQNFMWFTFEWKKISKSMNRIMLVTRIKGLDSICLYDEFADILENWLF